MAQTHTCSGYAEGIDLHVQSAPVHARHCLSCWLLTPTSSYDGLSDIPDIVDRPNAMGEGLQAPFPPKLALNIC